MLPMQEILRIRQPQSRAYEELVEVVTRAVEKLYTDWPAEREDVRSKSKLDECILPSRAQPQRRGLPFFPDLHTEVWHQLAVRHRDVVLAHMKELGLRLNTKKSVLSPPQKTTFLGVAWDSTSMQAHLSLARIESILSAVKCKRPGTSGSVYVLRDVSLSTLVLPHASSSSWTGRDGADEA